VDGRPLLRITLGNAGSPSVRYTLTANDFITRVRHETVKPGRTTTVDWPVDRWGYYDVVVTADDGFRHRYAGRVQ
jgi:phospholipase C